MSSAPPPRTQVLAPDAITLRIAAVRGVRVILDTDLAALYEVETKRFNEAVKRNIASFRRTSCCSSPPRSGRL